MALLQIAEPGQSAAPHEHKLAVGIDLGTTNSLVATVRSGLTVVLNDELGRPLLPSVVRYGKAGDIEVGYEAQRKQSQDARNTIVSVKRFMGRGKADITNIEAMPYDFVEAPGMVRLRTDAGEKSPVEVSAEILKTLRARLAAGPCLRSWCRAAVPGDPGDGRGQRPRLLPQHRQRRAEFAGGADGAGPVRDR